MKFNFGKRKSEKHKKKGVEVYLKKQQEGTIAPTDPEEMKEEVKKIVNKLEEETAKRQKKWFIVLSKCWGVLYVVALFALVGKLVQADLLPSKYLYGILTGAAVLSLILFPMLYFRNIRQGRKIVAMVLSLILMAGYAFAAVNLSDTTDFFSKVTEVQTQTMDYYVIVKKKSAYEKLEDLKGQKIGTVLSNSRNYSKAKNELLTRVKIDYHVVPTLSKMDNSLLDGECEALFVGKNTYNVLKDKEKKFKKKTRILFTLKMDLMDKASSKKVDVTNESFNVYISGLDTSGKITETSRSDVNMIVTVNPKTHTVLLTSIPRDYLIQLPSYNNAEDKLTHTGIYGVQETIGAVEKLTGLDMNYYVKVNYSTVTKFVDAIGGVDVISDYDFTTSGMKYIVHFNKGKNHLTGKKALAFARERHAFEDGDVQRNRDQIKVMEAILKKMTSSSTVLTKYGKILDSCKRYMEINMSADEIKSLVKMQLAGNYKWKIMQQSLRGDSVLRTCYSSGDFEVYVMNPDPKLLQTDVNDIVRVRDGITKAGNN